MVTNRNQFFDILRGIGIIGVVLGHVLNEAYASDVTEIIRKFIYIFHLPLFFFISGYFFKTDKISTFFKKKMKSLYLPCVGICIFSLLLVPFWVKFGVLDGVTKEKLIHKLVKIICFKADGYFVSACWFFPFLFVSLLLFEVVLQINSNKVVSIIIIVEGILGIYFTYFDLCNFYNLNLGLLMQPIIYMGYLIKSKKNKYRVFLYKLNLRIMLCTAVSIFVINTITNYEIELSKNKIYGNGILFYPMILIGLCFVCSLAKVIQAGTINKVFQYIGRNSEAIMMLHFMVFKLVDVFFKNYMAGNVLNTIYAFPQIRVVYLILGIAIPLFIKELFCRTKNYISCKRILKEFEE